MARYAMSGGTFDAFATSILLLLATPVAAQNCGTRLTNDNLSQDWGNRHSITSGGRVLWFDGNQHIFLFDGTSVIPVQQGNAGEPSLGSIDDVVFALGSGSAPGQVIGGWRRGTDFGWVTVNGGAPKLVTATNPITAGDPLNPEGVAIADGCVFMVLQAFSGGQAVKHLFKVAPATGAAVNLTGNAPVPGVSGRVRTSGCKAAWGFDVGDAANPDVRLQYYDGTTVHELGAGAPSDLASGRMIWIAPDAGNVDQIMLYDANLPAPAPTAITARTDAARPILFAQTDGRHVAWIESNAGFQDRRLMLLGGIEVSDASTRPANAPPNNEFPFQLRRGQLLWTAQGGKTWYHDGHSLQEACGDGWLADGHLAQLLIPSGEADTEVFLRQGTAPPGELTAPLVVRADPGNSSVNLSWDEILGAGTYHIYVAEQPGITPGNFATLAFGRRIVSGPGSTHVGCLRNGRTHYAAIAAVIGGIEGALSQEISFTPRPSWTKGQAAQGGLTPPFRAVTADIAIPGTLYAAGSNTVYKSTDDGETWVALAGGIENHTIRALGAHGTHVYAVTQQGDIFRSTDGGTKWDIVLDGEDIGEQRKALLIDPQSPAIVYAANIQTPTMTEPDDAYIVRSTSNGDPGTWQHLPEFPGIGAEIRAHTLLLTAGGALLAGGSGTPALGSTPDAGLNWTDLHFPAGKRVYSLAATPTASVIYGGSLDAVFKSENNGAPWTPADNGLPDGSFINALVIDPATPTTVFAGTDSGIFLSSDAGQNWSSFHDGLSDPSVLVNAFALTPAGYLVAAAADGLWRLKISADAQPTDSPDTDLDGTVDCLDACSGDPNKTAPGICGCGVADTDSDSDGTPNCNDSCSGDPAKTQPGVCGCGVADTDTDGDGTLNCNDLCPQDPAKTAPGACGCGVADTDGDGDGTPNCSDLCPQDAAKIAPGQCGCGAADTNSDGDTVPDCRDNCPNAANEDQADTNGDGVGDACTAAGGGGGSGGGSGGSGGGGNGEGGGSGGSGGGSGDGGGGSGGTGGTGGPGGGDTTVVTPDGGQSGQSSDTLDGQGSESTPPASTGCGGGACGAGVAGAVPLTLISLGWRRPYRKRRGTARSDSRVRR